MANPFDQFDETKPPDVTVTKIGEREIAQTGRNPFDTFDTPASSIAQTEQQKEEEKASVGEYLINAIKRGVISSTAALDALLSAGFSRMAATEMIKTGALPKEEGMRRAYGIGEESKPIIQSVSEALAESEKKYAPLVGADVEMQAPGPISKYVGAGLTAAADPLSYLGGIGLIKGPVRAGGEFLTGVASEAGGELGEATEKVITGGETTGAGRLLGAITTGVATAAPRQTATDVAENTLEQIRRNRQILKDAPGGAEKMYASGAAKSLLELAAKEQGAESVNALVQLANEASQFVNKADSPLVIAMADNPVIRQQVERLAKINPTFRQRINSVIEQASKDIEAKTTRMFGERYAAKVEPDAGLKVSPVVTRRRNQIERDLENLTEGVTPKVDPETLGSQIEALVEQRKKLARAEVSPKYNDLLNEARAKKIEMPSEGVGSIHKFVVDNNLRDIFGKGTALDRKIMSYLEPKAVEGKPGPAILGPDGQPITAPPKAEIQYPTLSFDNLDSLKKAINEVKRGRMSDDARRKINQLEGVVDQARETIPGDFSKRLADIDIEYYQKVGIPFDEQGIRDIDAKKYATQVAPVIVKNSESYRQFIRAVGEDKGNVLAENAIISEVYNKAVKDGQINARMLEKYIKDKQEIIAQIPGLDERLRKAALDDRDLRAKLDSLNDSAKAAEARVANNALTKFEVPDYTTLASSIINNPGQRQKIMRDISDLDPDTAKAVRNALRVEAINLGRRNAGGFMAYINDPANKSGVEAIFGTAFQPALRRLALFSDKVAQADISKLGVALDRRELDALQKLIPGVDIPYISSTLRDRITSLPQKVIRVLSKYNSAKLAEATDDAIIELLLDPNGVQKLASTITDVKFEISNPASVGKLADSLSRSVPRSFYTSTKTALISEEQQRKEEEKRRQEANDLVLGGFEEVPPMPFKKGGIVKRRPIYSHAEQDLLRRYSSR